MTYSIDENNEKPSVLIIWGSNGEQETKYGFNTIEELKAFLLGVEESNGWLDFEVVKVNPKDIYDTSK